MEPLHQFLKSYQDVRFKTGVNDCALFVAAWVQLLTGEDLAKDFLGNYANDTGSHRLIRKRGFKNLEHMVHELGDKYGVRRETPALAQRGDVVWVAGSEQSLCGIIGAPGVMVLSEKGLIALPLQKVICAWCITRGAV
jgi:hypothetical protein